MRHRSIGDAFARCRAERRAALIPYFTSGHPVGIAPHRVMRELEEAGADIIELGIPFSDPLADGPVIQASSFAALEGGASVESTLQALSAFRRGGGTVPVVLFSYLNPILCYGMESFLRDASESGGDGLLVTDLPVAADPATEERIAESPLDLIRLIAPTTETGRISEIARGASGFVYYISRTGVTGKAELRDALGVEVLAVRRAVKAPVAVGFGITTPQQAASVAAVAEGVVVGSALVRTLDEDGIEGATRFVRRLRAAVEGGA